MRPSWVHEAPSLPGVLGVVEWRRWAVIGVRGMGLRTVGVVVVVPRAWGVAGGRFSLLPPWVVPVP